MQIFSHCAVAKIIHYDNQIRHFLMTIQTFKKSFELLLPSHQSKECNELNDFILNSELHFFCIEAKLQY